MDNDGKVHLKLDFMLVSTNPNVRLRGAALLLIQVSTAQYAGSMLSPVLIALADGEPDPVIKFLFGQAAVLQAAVEEIDRFMGDDSLGGVG
jgi:hypothetical protein